MGGERADGPRGTDAGSGWVRMSGVTRDIVILGSTGSIGTQGLDIAARNPDRFRVVGLAAGGSNVELLARQAVRFEVPHVGVADEAAAARLEEAIATVSREAGRPGSAPTITAGRWSR